jgi:hypothetical protein
VFNTRVLTREETGELLNEETTIMGEQITESGMYGYVARMGEMGTDAKFQLETLIEETLDSLADIGG